jgi:hypothetical protein
VSRADPPLCHDEASDQAPGKNRTVHLPQGLAGRSNNASQRHGLAGGTSASARTRPCRSADSPGRERHPHREGVKFPKRVLDAYPQNSQNRVLKVLRVPALGSFPIFRLSAFKVFVAVSGHWRALGVDVVVDCGPAPRVAPLFHGGNPVEVTQQIEPCLDLIPGA